MSKFLSVILSVMLCAGCSTVKSPQILNTLTNHQQVLLVHQTSTHKPMGRLSAWECKNGHWQRVYDFPVVLGRTGLADLDAKREGDGHTPSGTFDIARAFGYEAQLNTKLDYRQATDKDFWVDDIHSYQYNQWVHGKPDANSFEHMRRSDDLYRMGAVIEYNTNPIALGKGSAIFLHIWRNYYKSTSGCVAASRRNIRRTLGWLDKNKNPVIVLTK